MAELVACGPSRDPETGFASSPRCAGLRRAQEAELVGDRQPALGERLNVLDGEMSTFAATPAVGIHERALCSIALPARARDFDWYVPVSQA
jgi:hypothetical protein